MIGFLLEWKRHRQLERLYEEFKNTDFSDSPPGIKGPEGFQGPIGEKGEQV